MKNYLRWIKLLLIFAAVGFSQQVGTNTALLTTPAPSGVFNQFASTTGTTGQTTYYYWVVAVYPIGMAVANGPVAVNTANATLDGSNYVTITWQKPNAAITGFWVVRSTLPTFPGTGTYAVNATVLASTVTSQTDQSNTLNSFTYTSIPFASSQWQMNNRDYSTSVVQLVDSAGNVLFGAPSGTQIVDNSGAVVKGSYVITGNATVTQINAGVTVLAAVTGRTLRVTGFEFQAVGGNFSGCTLVQIVDTAGTPIVSVGVPIADLTSGTIVTPASSSVVFTTYSWQGQLTASKGLALNQTGSACATATSMNYRISYSIN